MREIETVAVGLKAERFDFGDALDALLVQSSSRDNLRSSIFRPRQGAVARAREKCARATSIIDALDSLSIVIPAYNEENRLPQTLRQVLDWLARGKFSFREVIVVDDGSRDGTARVVEEFAQGNAMSAAGAEPRQSRQRVRGAERNAGGEGRVDSVHRRGSVDADCGDRETVPGGARARRGSRHRVASGGSKPGGSASAGAARTVGTVLSIW